VRKRTYVIGSVLALVLIALVGGYFYLIWIARIVEQITD
jgi:nitrate reductase NapE component